MNKSTYSVTVQWNLLAVIIALLMVFTAYGLHLYNNAYSYDAFYSQLTPVTRDLVGYCPPESTASVDAVVLCANTHTLPTRNQVMMWNEYEYWKLCTRYHDDYACKELQN